jgi:hypothetical protein
VTRRKNDLNGADAVTVVKKDRWWKFRARETEQLFPCFTCVERKVLPQESGLSLPNCKFNAREFVSNGVRGANMVKVGVRENHSANWRPRDREALIMADADPARPVSTRVSPSSSLTRKQLTMPKRVRRKRFLVS